MANSWVRLWHDMPTDPKFRTIARVATQPLTAVVAVFAFMLVDASANATERGRTQASDENIGSALDLSEDDVKSIRAAMQGRVLDGDKLTGWTNRQPLREDDSAARAKVWRESKKQERVAERDRTQTNSAKRPDTDTETDSEKGARATFDRLWEVFPRHPSSSHARALAAFMSTSVADRALLVAAVDRFTTDFRARCLKGNESEEAAKTFVPHLAKWIARGDWRTISPAQEASKNLVVIHQESPDFAALSDHRGRAPIVGRNGTVTVEKDELERARRNIHAA